MAILKESWLQPSLDPIPGKTTRLIEPITKNYRGYVVVGISETDPATGLAYNTSALIGPDGYIGKYGKIGLNPTDQLFFNPGNCGEAEPVSCPCLFADGSTGRHRAWRVKDGRSFFWHRSIRSVVKIGG
jgi:predicted amidohydrolase